MSGIKKFIFAGAPYSNSAPLVDKLTEVDPRVRVINDHPANLVADLNAGEADVALIPVAHLFSHPELVMLEGLGVAADGPVKSVLLRCNVPVEQINTVARDPASATSNALAKLLLEKHFFGGMPSPASADSEDAIPPVRQVKMIDGNEADAVVVIGDRALCSDPGPAGDIDLAEAWKDMTGLPFVFAVWAVRRDCPETETVTEIAHQACRAGRQSIEKIAARYAIELGNTQAFWRDYLTESIHYELDARDMEGLLEFQRLLVDMD